MPSQPLSLGPDRRVKRRKDYVYLQAKGKKTWAKHFLLLSFPSLAQKKIPSKLQNNSLTIERRLRIGVTVTKKINKRAVERNRIKRQVREFFRERQYNIRSGVDLVVVALRGASELSNCEIRKELHFAFNRARIYESGEVKPMQNSKQ